MTVLITGGCGFIGANFILNWFDNGQEKLVNIDNLSYAANTSITNLADDWNYAFIEADIRNHSVIYDVICAHMPRAIINFAAETHVDRSIKNPIDFASTNIDGTLSLLEAVRINKMSEIKELQNIRFIQISTDEVFGSLTRDDSPFTKNSRYYPNSPYSASKAAGDHFVRAYRQTYGIDTVLINCSNNYGPYQNSEKLIPKIIINALNNRNIPIYGDGRNIRDWLFVEDNCNAIALILEEGDPGENYLVGGECEIQNIDLAHLVCERLDEIIPRSDKQSYSSLISRSADRPGHDFRYSVDCTEIKQSLGWRRTISFEEGIDRTIKWYISQFQRQKTPV